MKNKIIQWILENFCLNARHEPSSNTRLLRFDNSRNNYRKRLRQAAKKYSNSILNYCITDKEIQFIISGDAQRLTNIIRYASSLTAADYSQRTNEEKPFWKERYNINIIQKGIHLLRFSLILDRMMIDREICIHQAEWIHSGYRDLTGIRKRYTIANVKKMAKLTGFTNEESFRKWYLQHSSEMSKELSGYLDKINKATAIGGKQEIEKISRMFPERYWTIEEIIPHETIPTFALFLANKTRQKFTRSLK